MTPPLSTLTNRELAVQAETYALLVSKAYLDRHLSELLIELAARLRMGDAYYRANATLEATKERDAKGLIALRAAHEAGKI